MSNPAEHISQLLKNVADGDESATNQLFPLVYDQLHRLASRMMQNERPDHTLQATALINEAFLILTRSDSSQSVVHHDHQPEAKNDEETPGDHRAMSPSCRDPRFENVEHFVALAAVVMRRILVNHAKAKRALKRGGGWSKIEIDEISSEFENRSIDLVKLDEALEKLLKLDSTQHRLVELRFFGGMTFADCAKILKLSERTIYYEWMHAKAWLRDQLEE